MKVTARKYGRRSSGGAIRVNLRLRAEPPRALTRDDAQRVFDQIVETGSIPKGYGLAIMDWQNPRKATGWRHGSIADLSAFAAVLAMAEQGKKGKSGLRLGVVKRTEL